ncbi:MAG: DUF4384 domain-containing protein, partial [Deinococcus sp.]
FPSNNDNFTYNIAGPTGVSKVLALASTTKLDLATLSSYKSNQKFATVTVKGQQNLAQALSIVVNPVTDTGWSTDVALVNVTPKPQAAAPATSTQAANSTTTTTTTTNTSTITLRPYAGATYARPVAVQNGSGYVFHSNAQVDALFKYYSAELVRVGYTQDEQTVKRDSATALFSKADGSGKATLTIKNTNGRIEVNVVRSQ